MFDLWQFGQFGLDVQEVMTTRLLRMMTGDLSSDETLLMITEKQAAYSHAQIACACALLTGGPVEAGREMIEVVVYAEPSQYYVMTYSARRWGRRCWSYCVSYPAISIC